MADYSIGVDLGGTNLRAAAIDSSGNVLGKISGSTNFTEGREAVLGDIASAILRLRDQFGVGGLAGIGVGVPGFIRMKEGLITSAPNLPYLEYYPVRDDLSRRVGAPVIIENDANSSALGEKWMGAGRDVDDLILLTLGTGIGGGIISNGSVLRGFLGMGAELGHITVVPDGNPCGCGNRGCLEKHASATAVTGMARLLFLGDRLTSRDLYDLARQDSPEGAKARRVWRIMGDSLGVGLAMLVNTFNFPLYLLSGGMLPAWEFFAPAMFATLEERSFTYRATKSETRVEQATLGNEAGLYGAAYLPWLK
jgi:glucokinase